MLSGLEVMRKFSEEKGKKKNVILGYTAFRIGPFQQILVYMSGSWCTKSEKQ